MNNPLTICIPTNRNVKGSEASIRSAISFCENNKSSLIISDNSKDNKKKGHHRGIGFSRHKNLAAYCGVGIELYVTDAVEIKLAKAWISIDAGEVAYKDGIKFQAEGGLIQASSWCLYEEVKYDANGIISKDILSINAIRLEI